MSTPRLVIANKAYSSWSLRPWVFLRHHGIAFEEVRLPMKTPQWQAEIRRHSPTGKVPALAHGEIRIWESLAILEYAAETWPRTRGWPADPAARALARAASTEMHAGFSALRSTLPMNVRRVFPARDWPPAVRADVDRICALWGECRERFGSGGPFLFGAFSVADAMFAPVVWRFTGYSVELPAHAAAYCRAMHDLPAMRAWHDEAMAEVEVLPEYEQQAPGR